MLFRYFLPVLTISTVFSLQILTCPDGEYLDYTPYPNQCKPCMVNCLTCASATVCTSCKDQYFLYPADSTCELKSIITTANCVQIEDKNTSPTVCSKCEDNYWLKNDKTCVKGTIDQCIAWIDNVATELCAVYNQGFYKLGKNLLNCTKIHEKCIVCNAETEGACTSCAQNSFLVAGTCVTKTKNCKTWDETSTTEKCSICEDGYSVHPLEFNCYASQCLNIKCGSSKTRDSAPICNVNCHDSHCDDCTTDAEDACVKCVDGYGLSEGKCYYKIAHCSRVLNDTHCNYCDDHYSLNPDKTKCVTITNCNWMANSTICNECFTGYTLFSNKCIESIPNCNQMQNTTHCRYCNGYSTLTYDRTECVTIRCDTGYTLISNECVQNIDHCEKMATATTCQSCKPYFSINAESTVCEGSIAHCQIMSSPSLCHTCENNFFLNFNKTQCITILFCDQFYYHNYGNCQACLTGYTLISNMCIENVDHCIKMANATTCHTCSDGYYLDPFNAVCIQCTDVNAKYVKLNCTGEGKRVKLPWTCVNLTSNCKENYPTPLVGETEQNCKVCETGYRLKDDHTCEECTDTNCHLCNSIKDICTECKFGYFLYQNACVFCQAGYYLKITNNSVSCVACGSGCSECKFSGYANDYICISCNEGYYLSYKSCYICPDNCKICKSNYYCITCDNGYAWDNNEDKCSKSGSLNSSSDSEQDIVSILSTVSGIIIIFCYTYFLFW